MSSIFTKIINGEIPAHHVFEDDRTLAIVDIYPIQTGQVLVFPKVEVDHFMDLASDDYHALWETVRVVSQKLRAEFPDKARIGVVVEGFEVAHAHVKLVPIDRGEDLRAIPDTSTPPNHPAFEELAERLREA